MSEFNSQDLVFSIPEYTDLVDFPTDFAEFAGAMPQYTTATSNSSNIVVTQDDINNIFDFRGADPDNIAEHEITFDPNGEYWKEIDGKGFGFQFGVATEEDQVTITPEDGAVVIGEIVPPHTFAIATRISDTTWLVVGGVAPSGPFIFNQSILGSADYYA